MLCCGDCCLFWWFGELMGKIDVVEVFVEIMDVFGYGFFLLLKILGYVSVCVLVLEVELGCVFGME